MRPGRARPVWVVRRDSHRGFALDPAPLALGQASPDAESLIIGQRVLEALGLDLAAGADLLGLTGRAALLGEERLRVGLRAQCALLPTLLLVLDEQAGNSEVDQGRVGSRHGACRSIHGHPFM